MYLIKILKILLVFIGCNYSFSILFGQNSNNNFRTNIIEKTHLFTDRDIYISGEKIWFTAYCLNSEDIQLSNILYIELYKNEGKSVEKKKVEILNGIAKGCIQIPEGIQTGNYILRAYTQYLRNFPPDYYTMQKIMVINPEISSNATINPSNSNTVSNLIFTKKSGATNEIIIKTNKNIYSPRELIRLYLSPNFTDSTKSILFNITVVKKGSFINSSKKIFNSSLKHSIKSDSIRNIGLDYNTDFVILKWIPETRDISISGIVRDVSSNQGIPNQQVFISVLGEEPQLHTNKTNNKGEFIFSLNNLHDIHNIYLTTKPVSNKKIEVLINNDFSENYPFLADSDIFIDSSKKIIEEMYINYQINKSFYSPTIDSIIAKKIFSNLFGDAEISIKLNEFVELPSLEEVFKEIIPFVKVKKHRKKYSLIVLDEETGQTYNDPLILLDNILIFDLDELMKISPPKIDKIEVINRQYIYGDFLFRGIILITTNTDDFNGYNFQKGQVFVEYKTLSISPKFDSPQYSSEIEKKSRVPDFRTLLYWNPDISLSDQDTTLLFYSSDHCSEYDIIVRGINNYGNPFLGKTSFEIKPDKSIFILNDF